jgi:hypothetical protein
MCIIVLITDRYVTKHPKQKNHKHSIYVCTQDILKMSQVIGRVE